MELLGSRALQHWSGHLAARRESCLCLTCLLTLSSLGPDTVVCASPTLADQVPMSATAQPQSLDSVATTIVAPSDLCSSGCECLPCPSPGVYLVPQLYICVLLFLAPWTGPFPQPACPLSSCHRTDPTWTPSLSVTRLSSHHCNLSYLFTF